MKNQGQCGSCWAFSTTGSLEGAWFIATGDLSPLSEQQLVDCDTVDSGCNGGLMDNGFAFAEKNAMCTEDSYSYTARKGTCKASSCTVGLAQGSVTGYKDVSTDSEQALMSAVAQQPVSIAIEADQSSFQSYSSGVLTASCGTKLDHGVLAVGYGTDVGTDYWKVKNSWGSSWGEQGYVRLQRGKGGAGECGLLAGPPSYPVVSGSPSPPSPPSPSPAPPATTFAHSLVVLLLVLGLGKKRRGLSFQHTGPRFVTAGGNVACLSSCVVPLEMKRRFKKQGILCSCDTSCQPLQFQILFVGADKFGCINTRGIGQSCSRCSGAFIGQMLFPFKSCKQSLVTTCFCLR